MGQRRERGVRTGAGPARSWPRPLALVLLATLDVRVRRGGDGHASPYGAAAFRLFNESDHSEPYFEPHERGFVGSTGDPRTLLRERVNEGGGSVNSFPRQQEPVHARQNCSGMVGPLGDGKYYCLGKEHGYCDRRSGTCFCSVGYQGLECGDCTPTHFKIGARCVPKKACPGDCSGAGTCDHRSGTCTCEPHR